MNDDAYRQAGVDIDAGRQATDLMKAAVQATYTDAVLSHVGSFGGLFATSQFAGMADPVLVASTDGVGTKTLVAARMQRWDTIGQDLVNHCINDILVQGAHPLFFLDYVASSRLEPAQIASVVGGMARACQASGVVLLGGETAEMPGVYHEGAIDLVGTIVGVVPRQAIIDGRRIVAGDVILGLASSGLHTNGYSLARQALAHINWSQPHSMLGESVGEALLKVHRSYLEPVRKLEQAGITIKGLAHITGGGLIDNIPRILPQGLGAEIRRGSWPISPVFRLIQSLSDATEQTMYRTFNMGLGLVIVVAASDAEQVAALTDAYLVGQIVPGETVVHLVGGEEQP